MTSMTDNSDVAGILAPLWSPSYVLSARRRAARATSFAESGMDENEDLVGALAGRYDIEREIGRGGMAIVYLAHDVKHHRSIALKVLRPELTASLGPERFLREIAITASLVHPNILALYDSGEA